MKIPVFKIFAYKQFFVKTVIRISHSMKVNHLISKKLYQKQNGFKFIQETLVALHENWFLLCRGDFFHPYDLSINFRTFKKKQAYHFNILKRNLCIIINI